MARIAEIVRERIARLFYGLFMWALKASMPKRMLKENTSHCNNHVGVACVLSPTHANVRAGKIEILHSCMIKPPSQSSQPSRSSPFSWLSSSPTSSSWSTSANGDLLGTESGVHMLAAKDIPPWTDTKPYIPKKGMQGKEHVAKKRDIPPPISILTGPHKFLDTVRDKGRLIVTLVTVEEGEQEEDINNPSGNEDGEEGVVEAAGADRKGKRPVVAIGGAEEDLQN